jgi:oxygen-dependent protoporphyrinogen oxidase
VGATHVVVVGAGVAGLVAARDLVARGATVTVLEAGERAGGCVAAHDVAGLHLDCGAEAFATRGGTVRALLDDLGLAADVVTPAASGAWVRLADRSVPLPVAGLLGIPADPRSPEVRRAVGRTGAARAALDRVLPARVGLPPGPTSVADLVRARMGRRVLDRLVAPVVAGVYSAPPELADLDTVLPGVRELLRSTGSLSAAVTNRRAAAPAGSAVASLAGGMHRLVDALVADLRSRGADLRLHAAAAAVARADGGWRVTLADGGALDAGALVLAVPGPVAVRILEPHVPEAVALAGPTADVVLVTLVLDAPALDTAPRGTGVLVAIGARGVRAKALTHATAKWAWLARAAGPGRHVLRLSYGRAEDPAHTEGLLDGPPERLRDQALTDAARLLGVPLTQDRLVGAATTRWPGAIVPARPGHRDAVTRLRTALGAVPGLAVTGSWVAGTGLAAVVADARAAAASLPLDDA